MKACGSGRILLWPYEIIALEICSQRSWTRNTGLLVANANMGNQRGEVNIKLQQFNGATRRRETDNAALEEQDLVRCASARDVALLVSNN
jgi:hypothetical protein